MSRAKLRQWAYTGHNTRVPNENNASWLELIKDDLSQITRTEDAYKQSLLGPVGLLQGWRPWVAFTPSMIKTGPTPLLRQMALRLRRTTKSILRYAWGKVDPPRPL